MPEKKSLQTKRFLVYLLLFISFVCILVAGYMGTKIFERVSHRPPPIPRQTDVSLIQDWMTIPFIAKSYRIPEPELYKAIGIDQPTDRKASLSSLAIKSGKSQQEIINQIKKAVEDFQKNQPSPQPN